MVIERAISSVGRAGCLHHQGQGFKSLIAHYKQMSSARMCRAILYVSDKGLERRSRYTSELACAGRRSEACRRVVFRAT